MKQAIKLTILIFFCAGAAQAQHPGYLGKKNVVEVFAQGMAPLTANAFSDNNDYAYESFSEFRVIGGKKDRFDYGWNVGFTHAFSKNFAMGIEYGKNYFSIIPPFFQMTHSSGSAGSVDGEFGRLPVETSIIMPKIEFSGKNGLLPIGLIHQLGFGIRTYKLVDKPIEYRNLSIYGDPLSSAEIASFEQNALNYKEKYKGFSLMYSIQSRTPVSRNLLLLYGVRYFGNWTKLEHFDNNVVAPYLSTEADVEDQIRTRTFMSVIWVTFGTAFVF